MSQYDFGTINPATKSGTDLASDLNSWRTAINSSHKGSTAPSYRIAGTVWLDDASTPWLDKIYDGADWIVRGSVNASTNAYTPYLAGVAIGNSSTSAVGLIEQATSAEVLAMSSSSLAVTPSGIGALIKQGSTLTAANALSVSSGAGGLFEVDGATDIHSISDAGSPSNGRAVTLRFIHATPGLLRHNVSGTERVFLPNAQDIDLKQYDIVELTRLGANWHLTKYIPYAGFGNPLNRLGMGYISPFGLQLSRDAVDLSNDIAISPGEARDDGNAVDMILSAILTKRIDASWAVGDDAGGMDTGSVANSTWYYVWLIRRPDTGVVDALFSLSTSSPTMPANYTQKRRLGAVFRSGASQNTSFTQKGNLFLWTTAAQAAGGTDLSTTAANITLLVPAIDGITALVRANLDGNSAGRDVVLTSMYESDQAPSITVEPLSSLRVNANLTVVSGHFEFLMDSTRQIRARATGSNSDVLVSTYGWIDPRA